MWSKKTPRISGFFWDFWSAFFLAGFFSTNPVQASRQFGQSALLLCSLAWELASPLPQKIMLWCEVELEVAVLSLLQLPRTLGLLHLN